MLYCISYCSYLNVLGTKKDPRICCLTCPERSKCIESADSSPCIEARIHKFQGCPESISEEEYILEKILE